MTSSTEASRCARASAGGTSNGTRAADRLRLARTMRCATVDSDARKARAISAVDRPPSSRSVSATRASVDSSGWQAVNIRRSRSSPISSCRAASSASTKSGSTSACKASSSRPICSCLRVCSASSRRRSRARFFAVVISHAPGLSGTPVSGQRSRAATSASCASSSARPTSRTRRATPAMTLAASIRQTASIARWVAASAVIRRASRRAPCTPAPRRGRPGPRSRGHT